ncbi:protogenin [Caerostris extrusa]|uniref:Protogenin n=1 Tax=Caerostris extrusa TaxID=172846 RepID=A0AAV4XVU5_CAEEX|nr:protogenin [Caerostris extrusa]
MRKIITSSEDNPDAETVEVEEPPHQLEVEPTSSTRIRLTWRAPETSRNISYYTVRYHPVFASGLVNESSISYIRRVVLLFLPKRGSNTNNEVLITDLQPYTLYEFAVRAMMWINVKVLLAQRWSVELKKLKLENDIFLSCIFTVPTAPQDLVWSPIDANSIRLNWQPPKYPNGTESTTLLTGLTSNTLYYLRMKVKNGAGMSLPTEILNINIPVRHNNTTPPSHDVLNPQSPDQYLGIAIGAFIGLSFLIICAVIMKIETNEHLTVDDQICCPSPPADPNVTDARYSACRGNGYIPQMNGHIARGLPSESGIRQREPRNGVLYSYAEQLPKWFQ